MADSIAPAKPAYYAEEPRDIEVGEDVYLYHSCKIRRSRDNVCVAIAGAVETPELLRLLNGGGEAEGIGDAALASIVRAHQAGRLRMAIGVLDREGSTPPDRVPLTTSTFGDFNCETAAEVGRIFGALGATLAGCMSDVKSTLRPHECEAIDEAYAGMRAGGGGEGFMTIAVDREDEEAGR